MGYCPYRDRRHDVKIQNNHHRWVWNSVDNINRIKRVNNNYWYFRIERNHEILIVELKISMSSKNKIKTLAYKYLKELNYII